MEDTSSLFLVDELEDELKLGAPPKVGLEDLSGALFRPLTPTNRTPHRPMLNKVKEESTGPREAELAKAAADSRIRSMYATAGALISVGVLLFYYVPGMRRSQDENDFFLLIFPAALLMFPWALLALFLRVKTVWVLCGLLMIYMTFGASSGLNDDPKDGVSLSILDFMFLSFGHLVFIGVALVIDLAIRGVRRAKGRGRPSKGSL